MTLDDDRPASHGFTATPEGYSATPPLPPGRLAKVPVLAGFLSFFPGMGNIYNGLYFRGLTFFLIVAGLMGIAQSENGHELFGFAVAFFWIFNILDAYRQATLINLGYAQDLGLTDLPSNPRAAQGGLAAGVILLLIGLVGTLDRYFRIVLSWLFDSWPVILMLVGAGLIVAALRQRSKAAEARQEGM
jgi:hypothetical protein